MTNSATRLALDWQQSDGAVPLRDREWLVTNGLGGFASGTLLGIPTRRYHGMFVPNLVRPKGRYVLVSRLDEDVLLPDRVVELGGAEDIDEGLHSDTHRYLQSFVLDHQMPTWTYAIDGRVLEKTIVMPQHRNTVLVRYRLLSGDAVRMRLRIYGAFRRQDAELKHDASLPFKLAAGAEFHQLYDDASGLRLHFGVAPQSSAFVEDARSAEIMYRVERDRGYDHREKVFSPGYCEVELEQRNPITFAATSERWDALRIDAQTAIDAERSRIGRLISLSGVPATDDFAAHLVQAADQFIVLPGSRLEEVPLAEAEGEELRTVIAGYHWFGDWGRDTMISLAGLTLSTGRHREAGAILRTFARYVKDGLLPNLFPEGARLPLYHTVDATLWYFHAIDRYQQLAGDREIVRELYPVLQSIVEHHVAGTSFGIGVDEHDGLLREGEEGYQLTWMDAKCDGWVVTPRRGKPVEIQALWYNALKLMASWGVEQDSWVGDYERWAERARESFNQRFWFESGNHLFDVVDSEGGDDSSCRPNQMFSLSLKFPILDESRWHAVMETIEQKLLTPYGLRTLSRDHPDYKRNYHGDLRTRDAAYHQGTVWPWLIGHYVDAVLRVYGDKARARALLSAFPGHLRDAGFGSISEVFDAESPYLPRGCIAQAWSVAEVLRAWQATQ